ncbi:MAG TPA: response regulator transcription factor [Tepidisphaeraceae bacterium]|jgi:DNA-binding NarL/FixJ family response regulator
MAVHEASFSSGQPAIKQARVLIVEDHAVVLEGLATLIDDEPDFKVVGGAENAEEALKLVSQVKPDVVIVDIALGETSGLDLIKQLHDDRPSMPLLALSMHDESLYAERALRAGAKGYIMKKEARKKVMDALRQVLGGEIYVSEKVALRMAHKLVDRQSSKGGSVLEQLSDREFEIFNLIAHGVGPTEIANRLQVSVKTVETHRERIKQKLDLKTGQALTRFAVEWSMQQR